MRRTGQMVAHLGVLALCASTATAQQTVQAKDLGVELPRQKREHQTVKELLGRGRWRRLNAARFDIDLHALDFTPDLLDNPDRLAEVEDVLLGSVAKLARKRFERRFHLEESYDGFRKRLRRSGVQKRDLAGHDRTRLRISPRFQVDSRSSVGAKLRLAGHDSRFWSGASLRVIRELGGDDLSLKLSFDDEHRRAFLVYHTDQRRRGPGASSGQAIEFKIGFWF